jgi:putative flippase GtrA
MRNFINKNKSIILYVIFGGLTTLVDWTVSFLLYRWMDPHSANVIAWVAAVLFAFAVNKIWVFESRIKGFIPVMKELFSFSLGRLGSLGMQELIVFLAVDLGRLDAVHDAFETPELYRLNELLAPLDARVQYQAEYFLPDVDAVMAAERPCPLELRVLGPDDFRELYVPAWSNALCDKRPQLDVLGVGAFDGETLVGLAGCSADCAQMWQIGIDVLPNYRRQGIAAALTNRIARETFDREMVPFYCAAWSNVRSVRNALASGFKPAWVEVTARPCE